MEPPPKTPCAEHTQLRSQHQQPHLKNKTRSVITNEFLLPSNLYQSGLV